MPRSAAVVAAVLADGHLKRPWVGLSRSMPLPAALICAWTPVLEPLMALRRSSTVVAVARLTVGGGLAVGQDQGPCVDAGAVLQIGELGEGGEPWR